MSFDENRFTRQVNAALERIKSVIQNTRQPTFPASVPHKYDDKYHLADFLTNSSLAAQFNALEALGLDEKKLRQLEKWATQGKAVSLRLKAEERCLYDKEVQRKETDPTEYVTKTTGIINATVTQKVVTTITEYFWKFSVEYELFAYAGTNIEDKVVFQSRHGAFEMMTTSKSTPKPSSTVVPSIDVNITWLLKKLNDNLTLNFSINRLHERCHTPRRNQDIEEAFCHFREFSQWAGRVNSYFTSQLFPVQTSHGLDISKINGFSLFVPVVPLFEDSPQVLPTLPKDEKALAVVPVNPKFLEGPLLPFGDINSLLVEQKRNFVEKFSELAKMFPDNGKLITQAEAIICVVCQHAQQITQCFVDGVEYIEDMLRKQLIAAIGKELTPVDFTNYMKHHNRVLFKEEYQPRPFCYAIRRPEHYPEGTLSIEAQLSDGSMAEPLPTIVSHTKAVDLISFNINAATKIFFGGDRYLHAWVSHEFSGHSGLKLNLIARARQFSSFIMLVGTMNSATSFDPKAAIIIQNKDDLKIPLLLETIPTPKQFRDAIESLSPEQQRFAKAYRSMQLASTLFGVVIIQIKPQLEKLLKLPDDSLTKEIKLYQDLMRLFIEYQIPSDLLSYDKYPGAPLVEKLEAVKSYTSNMLEMINSQQKKQLEERKEEFKFSEAEISAPSPFYDSCIVEKSCEMAIPVLRSARLAPLSLSPPPKAKMMSMALPSSPSPSQPPKPSQPVRVTVPIPAPVSAPVPTPSEPSQHEKPSIVIKEEIKGIDYTKIPTELDQKFEALDEDSALHSTIIKMDTIWIKKSQKSLLATTSEEVLTTTEQTTERNKAFDLLDALTRSGILPIDYAELHVVLGATHTFDKTLLNTVIQDNVNPIEKVERSLLIVATTIHSTTADNLVKEDQIERVSTYSPTLFGLPSLKERRALEGQNKL